MAACPDLPHELVTAQQRTVSLHSPTVAARLAVDPEVRPLEDGPRFRLGHGMAVRSVRLPNPIWRNILEGLHFTRGEGADVWAAVQRQLPDAWHKSLRPPRHERLVGWSRECGRQIGRARQWSRGQGSWAPVPAGRRLRWVILRGVGAHAVKARRGTVVARDGRVALQLAEEPLTTHVVVVAL